MHDADKAAVSNHCAAAGRKGGSVCNPHKGLGNPAVLAKSIATRKAKAAALRLAAARALVAEADGFSITPEKQLPVNGPYANEPEPAKTIMISELEAMDDIEVIL